MARLKMLKPSIGMLAPTLGFAQGDERERSRQRDRSEPLRALYKSARWARCRIATFTRDQFTCRMCGRLEGDTSKLICDHIDPHRGDEVKFWNAANHQTLCKRCHDGAKRRAEQATKHTRGVWY